jgi:Skp family chaperone for outer membrane proteins
MPTLRFLPPFRSSCLLVFACLLGCDGPKVEQNEAVSAPRRFIYRASPPRVATHLPENFSQWSRVLQSQHTEMQALQAKLAEKREIHLANHFDDFLKADLSTLAAEPLASLWHFADKGYFTIERRIVKRLLEDRLAESDPQLNPAKGSNIGERAALFAKQNELKIRDLRTAAELYDALQAKGEFPIPQPANPEELEALRKLAADKLQGTRQEITTLDAEIQQLQQTLNKNLAP